MPFARGLAPLVLLATALVAQLAEAAGPVGNASGSVMLQIPGGQRVRLYSASYALVIGAANYRLGWKPLPEVPGDVKAVAALFAELGFDVTSVLNPTRDQLDKALRSFVQLHGQAPNNRLVIYFAGHGYTLTTAAGGQLGYIVPVDAPLPSPAANLPAFKSMAYSMQIIEELAHEIDSKHALFIFDSCFSGTIFRTRSSGIPDNITEKTAWPVREFITSGDESQQVPDFSVFRRQLEAGLRGAADRNRDGYITGSELGSYLEETVTDYTRRTQTPRSGKIRDQDLDRGDIVFESPSTANTTGRTIAAPVEAQRPQVRRGVDPSASDPPGFDARAVTDEGSAGSDKRREVAPALFVRLNGAAFYEPRLDATLIADANLPATLPLGVRGIGPDGSMAWATAKAWVAALNRVAYLGFSDWRLPQVRPLDGVSLRMNDDSNDPHAGDKGRMDIGYNLTAPGTRYERSTAAELPYLFYNTLHGRSRHAQDGTEQDNPIDTNRPLRHLQRGGYWTETAWVGGAFAFDFGTGTQYAYQASTPANPDAGFRYFAMVLRSGDVNPDSSVK